MDSNTTAAPVAATPSLKMARALMAIEQTERLIHAAWMAAGSLGENEIAAGEALQAVIHLAGEELETVRAEVRKAGAA